MILDMQYKTTITTNLFYIVDGNAGCTMLQLYATGTDTTSTALQWALLYMCYYPHVQEKVQSEIDDKIGKFQILVSICNMKFTQ